METIFFFTAKRLNFTNRQHVRSKNSDGSWKTSWKLLCIFREQSHCVLGYFKPHQRRVLTRGALVFLTGYETCWMKVVNCSGLQCCSNNRNNISSFLSNHRYLSLRPLKWSLCVSLRVCVCSWLKARMKLNACSTGYLCWLYFHGMITSTLLCGCGPWDSVNIPL